MSMLKKMIWSFIFFKKIRLFCFEYMNKIIGFVLFLIFIFLLFIFFFMILMIVNGYYIVIIDFLKFVFFFFILNL